MSGPADLPEGFVLDEAPNPGDDSEGMTLAGILRDAGIDPATVLLPQTQTRHERMEQHLHAAAQPAGLAVADFGDTPERIATWASTLAGRVIGFEPTWIRYIRPDLRRGALFIAHSPHPDNEAELIVIADKGVITRPLIADACRWAFFGLALGRVVVRIPADRPDLADLARRAGFQFEGTARRACRGTADVQVWAMTGADCRWTAPRRAGSAPVSNTSPPPSLKVH